MAGATAQALAELILLRDGQWSSSGKWLLRRLRDWAPDVAAMLVDASPVDRLAALKHPLAAGGMVRAEFRERARRIDRSVLRGPRREGGQDDRLRGQTAHADGAGTGAERDVAGASPCG